MELSSILHVADHRFAYALDKNQFCIRVRTKKGDLAHVVLHYRDKYIPLQFFDSRKEVEMKIYASDYVFDYYEAIITIDVICLRYFFEFIDHEGNKAYFGNNRFYKQIITSNDFMFDLPQNVREEERYVVPKWAENKIIYQIFPARFASSINVSKEIWYQEPISHMANLGGNLRGIINHLDHIKELGADLIYMTPIFKSTSMHKYNISDYYKIDPTFGTKEDLIELVSKAHKLGMKVILDGVFNHTGTDFFAFDDCIKNKEDSAYWDWYYIKNSPVKMKWGPECNYKTFAYFFGMPKINENNPVARKYFIDVATYWIKEADIDGWRLDVADEVSHVFWKEFRKAVKKVKPEALIIGEVWHYAEDFLDGDEWDTVMNYDFYFSVRELIANETLTVSDFYAELETIKGRCHKAIYPYLWNLLDSHDTERFYNACKYDKKKEMLAIALQLLLPGMPLVYYGDEYGMKGSHDPDNRRGMYWDKEYQDLDFFEWYKKLIAIRKKHPNILLDNISVKAIDETGILILDKKEYVLIFNTKSEKQELLDYKNYLDLVSNQKFNGILEGYNCLVLQK